MTLLIKIILSLIIIVMAYFALTRIWTKDIDITGFLKKPSESIPIKEAAVIVVPSEIDLTTSTWGKVQVVEIKNTKAAMTLYSVWIKLKTQTPVLSIEDIDIDILSETGEAFVSESFGGLNFNYDLIQFRALDAEKHPCVYLLIYNLKGLESRFLKVKRKSSNDTNKKPLILSLTVIGFSENPAPFVTKNGATGPTFTPPESITVESIWFLVKKR